MIHNPHNVLFRVHRALTMGILRRLLRRGMPRPAYAPAPRRVLYVAASSLPYHISGYTTRTHELVRAMTALGAEVHALTRPGYPWDRSDRLVEPDSGATFFDGVLYAHCRRPSKHRLVAHYAVRAAAQIAGRAEAARAGCIHAASNHVNALPALLAARRLGIPFQYEMRGLWELTRASRAPGYENSHDFTLGLELEGLTASHADRVLVISERLGQYAMQAWNIAAERISLLPNCVDPDRIGPGDPRVVSPNTIGYSGSLIGYEGLDSLIEAVGILAGQGVDARLEIIGDGEARPDLEGLVERLGLAERVHLRGRVAPHEARAMIAGCALVCIPRKPFKVCEIVPPIKLVEAMSMARPVIVPDLPVFRDELGAQAPGFFFKAGDAGDLARVLGGALANPQALAELGGKARDWVLERRQWRDHAAGALRPVME
jgi:glycosyltransferase involved in cell wall biosynthesis